MFKLDINHNFILKCSQHKEMHKTLNEYRDNCLDKLSRISANLLSYSIDKKNKAICKSSRRSAELIQTAGCGNAANKLNRKCFNIWTDNFDGINYMKDLKMKLPLMCWLV